MPIYASLTTIPSRLPHIEPCLKSILADQGFDKVFLNVPILSLKGKPYPDEELKTLQVNLGDRLVIHRVPKDHGPITKLVGALDVIMDSEDMIVVFDDDRELLNPVSQLFASRIEANPLQAYSLGGWCFGKSYKVQLINPADIEVDSLMGTTCIAFCRGLVNVDDLLSFKSDDSRLSKLDDMRISGYWASRGIKRVVIGGRVKDFLRDIKYPGTESLSGNIRFWMDNKAVIDQLAKEGLFKMDSSGGLAVEWFSISILLSIILIGFGLFRVYKKMKEGYIIFITGLIIGFIAVFQLSSFML
jgi:hypothetical protein